MIFMSSALAYDSNASLSDVLKAIYAQFQAYNIASEGNYYSSSENYAESSNVRLLIQKTCRTSCTEDVLISS